MNARSDFIIAQLPPPIAVTGQIVREVIPDEELENVRFSIIVAGTIAIVAGIIGLGSFWVWMAITSVLGILAIIAGGTLSLLSILIGVAAVIHTRFLHSMRSEPCCFKPQTFWKYMFVGFAGLIGAGVEAGIQSALATSRLCTSFSPSYQ